jgi:hypothetical protein
MAQNKAFQNLLNAVQKAKNGAPANRDETENLFWRAEPDKSGNAYSQIRFLSGKTEDDTPFVKTYNHGFQGPGGKWYIENCPTTIGKDCPCCAANGVIVNENGGWNSTPEKVKALVRERKRRISYIANILVVSDPKNPENDGQVKLFKFGQKIFDKLVDKLQPPVDEKGNPIDPDEVPMNPFDPVEGATFKLKMRKVEGYSNFDKSEFDKPSEIDNWDEIADKLIDLSQFTDEKSFKSYSDLEAKFNMVVGNSARSAVKASDDDDDDVKPVKKAEAKKAAKDEDESSDADDDLSYFRSLASED